MRLLLVLLALLACAPAPEVPPPDAPRPDAPVGGDPRKASPDAPLPNVDAAPPARAPDEAAWRDAAHAEMRGSRADVQRCVETRLRAAPDFAGRWTVHLVAGHDGVPRDVRVVGDERSDPALEQCLAAVAATWRFPRASEARAIAMPYVFGGTSGGEAGP